MILQHVLYMDPTHLGYTEEGHCRGAPHPNLPGPQRLQWDISTEVGQSSKWTSGNMGTGSGTKEDDWFTNLLRPSEENIEGITLPI